MEVENFQKRFLSFFLALILLLSSCPVGQVAFARQDETEAVIEEEISTSNFTAENFEVGDHWYYFEEGVDPTLRDGSYNEDDNWTVGKFAEGVAFKQGMAPFGAKRGNPHTSGGFYSNTTLKQYYDGTSKNIPTYFFVQKSNFNEVEGKDLSFTIHYDDAAVVFLNGHKIWEGNTLDYSSNISYGAENAGGYPNEDEVTILAQDLVNIIEEGENYISVRLHQDRESSSDIYFDLQNLRLEDGEFIIDDPIIVDPIIDNEDENTPTELGPDEWQYFDEGEDPTLLDGSENQADNWTIRKFAPGMEEKIKIGQRPFGAKNGYEYSSWLFYYVSNTTLKQYFDDSDKNIPSYFFIKTFNLEDVNGKDLSFNIHFDDAAVVFLNGHKIWEENTVDYSSNLSYGAMFSYGDPTEREVIIPSYELKDIIKEGNNDIAVRLHQANETSSDIYFDFFDLTLIGKDQESMSEVRYPVLTIGATSSDRNFTWYSKNDTAYAVLNKELAYGEKEKVQELEAVTQGGINANNYYSHQVSFSDLEPNTTYTIDLLHSVEKMEAERGYTFTTPEMTGDFSFFAAGDPQIGAYGVSWDSEGWKTMLESLPARNPNAHFLLSLGDQVETSYNEEEYSGFIEQDALEGLTLSTVIGNHDAYAYSTAYSEHFALPNKTGLAASYAGDNYYFVYNNTLFILLNSNYEGWSGGVADHKETIRQAIEATKDNEDIRWKVVAFHHSIYSTASHTWDSDIKARRNSYPQVFKEFDIDVVLMGHDHVYARSHLMDGGNPMIEWDKDAEGNEVAKAKHVNPEGILYVTANSASGSKHYNLLSNIPAFSAVQNQEYKPNISDVHVSDNSFKITTYRLDGSVVDEVELVKEEKEQEASTYSLTTKLVEGKGTITESQKDLKKDSKVTIDIVPEEGYEIKEVKVNGETVTVEENKLDLVMDEDKTVEVSFKEKTPVELGEDDWYYFEDGEDPTLLDGSANEADNWTIGKFAAGMEKKIKVGKRPFGAKRGGPHTSGGFYSETTLKQYYDDRSDDIPTYFFIKKFDLQDVKDKDLSFTIHYDDAALVFLNGQKIWEGNTVNYTGNIDYGSQSGRSNPNVDEVIIKAEELEGIIQEGENYLAVRLHQDRSTSSDIYFDFLDLKLVDTEKPALVSESPIVDPAIEGGMLLQGKAVAGAKIQLVDEEGNLLGQAIVGQDGSWEIALKEGLKFDAKVYVLQVEEGKESSEKIPVSIEALPSYNLTTKLVEGKGTITESQKDLKKDSKVTVDIVPEEGYEIKEVKVNGETVTVEENKLDLVMDEDKTVEVSFKKEETVKPDPDVDEKPDQDEDNKPDPDVDVKPDPDVDNKPDSDTGKKDPVIIDKEPSLPVKKDISGYLTSAIYVRPSKGSSDSLGILSKGSFVKGLVDGNWLRIDYQGKPAYIAKRFVSGVLAKEDPEKPVHGYTKSSVYVRDYPNSKDYITILPRGSEVSGVRKGAWVEFTENGKTAYVAFWTLTDKPELTGYLTAPLYLRPEKNSGDYLTILSLGEKVTGEIDGAWLKINYKGQDVYLALAYVSPEPTIVRGKLSSSIYVRPEKNSQKSLGILSKGSEVSGAPEGAWLKIQYKGSSAYIAKRFVK